MFMLLLVSACNDHGSNMTNKSSTIELALHAPIQLVVSRSPVKFSQECMQNLGMCWYEVSNSANNKNLPTVVIKTPHGLLDVPQVTGVTIVEDDRVGSDVENIDLSLRGLPDNSTHEQNRDFIYSLIEVIKSAGWKHYYSPGDPRISGSQANKINAPDNVLGAYVSSHPWFDPDYKMDMGNWVKVRAFYRWCFYSDGDYLTLKAWRNDSSADPAMKGTYLITMEFRTEEDFWMQEFSGDKDRANWKALLPARLKKYQEGRFVLEEKARAAGIEIDETYKDPPIQALSK